MEFIFKCHRCGTSATTTVDRIGTEFRCGTCTLEQNVPLTGFRSGMVLDDYWIHHRMGEGTISEVYLAKIMSSEEKVFLKVLSPLATVTEEAAKGFLKTLSQSKRIDHPNVVSVTNTGYLRGHYYAATPHVQGECLDAIVAQNGPLPEMDALQVCLSVAKLARKIWKEHRLLHQAIKPANILLNKEGEVFLLDYCNSKQCLVPDSGLIETINPKGNMFDFMSPEQIQNLPDLDPRSDIYSLGATLYFIISGRKPYVDTMTTTIAQKHLWKPPPGMKGGPREVSSRTSDLVHWMMEGVLPGESKTWEELIKRIRKIIKKPTRSGATGKNLSRPRTRSTSSPGRRRETGEQEGQVADPQRQKNNKGLIAAIAAVLLVVMIGGGIWLASRPPDSSRRQQNGLRLDDRLLQSDIHRVRTEARRNPSQAAALMDYLTGLKRRTNDAGQLRQIDETRSVVRRIAGSTEGTTPTDSGGSGKASAVSFDLLKPDGSSRGQLQDGAKLMISEVTLDFNAQVAVQGGVKSVRFHLTGTPEPHERLTVFSPYTLFPKNRQLSLSPGSYRLKVTPYSDSKGKVPGKPLEIEFVIERKAEEKKPVEPSRDPIVDKPPPPPPPPPPDPLTIAGFSLRLNGNRASLVTLKDGQTVLGRSMPMRLNVYAQTSKNVRGVRFKLKGKGVESGRDDNNGPFTLITNKRDINLGPGSYTVWATPYADGRCKSEPGTTKTISFTIAAEDPPKKPVEPVKRPVALTNPPKDQGIVGFKLVNAATNQSMGSLKSGRKIRRRQTPKFNIQAVTKGTVGSVVFKLCGPSEWDRVEDGAPWAVWGDNGRGDYFAAKGLANGEYTLTATAYSSKKGKGTQVGKTVTFKFHLTK